MNRSPYDNYWEDCNKLISLSDRIGRLDPTCSEHLSLCYKYNDIEKKFYKKYLSHHKIEHLSHPDRWFLFLKIKKEIYGFQFSISERMKCCEIKFTTDREDYNIFLKGYNYEGHIKRGERSFPKPIRRSAT
jgi:hypothetical protein